MSASFYYVIKPGVPIPLGGIKTRIYDIARSASVRLGGIVTNESWLKSRGAKL